MNKTGIVRYCATFHWDANGNMATYVNAPTQNTRIHFWDEENRLKAIETYSNVGYYGYDAAGERAYKLTVAVGRANYNGYSYAYSNITGYTLYPSPYLVATTNQYTKHYYAGTERVVSKMGGGGLSDLISNSDNKSKEMQATSAYENIFRQFAEPYTDIRDDFDLAKFNEEMRYYQTLETDLYFYHPDHLSSASWITDSGGLPMQHLQYMPFGETRVDQRATGSNWSTRYSFSAKEMDEESRYHYFGARYYDSDLSIFLSMDPMASKYPSLTPYAYVANNPIKLVDPNGEEIWITGADGSKTLYTQGMKYEGGDKFVGKAVNALNKLNGTKFGGKVIGMLAESKTNNVDIISATKSEWNSTISRDESGNKTGMNGTLSWNENGTDLWVEGNAYSELAKNPVTDMGHEFAHAFDDMMDVSLPIDKIEDVSKHEWMAVYRENIMRKELKLPYRTYFGNTDGPRMVQKGVPYLPFSYPHINK